MRPQLPLFEGTECQYLRACASTDDPKARSLLPEKTIIIGYNASPGRVYARLTPVRNLEEAHFHVDIALGKSFGPYKPRSTHRKAQFLSVLHRLSLFTWISRFDGYFLTSRANGSQFYDALETRVDIDERAEVSLTGIEFSFRQTHLDRLSVRLLERTALVDMHGTQVIGTIEEDYFTSALAIFETYFGAFTHGDGK